MCGLAGFVDFEKKTNIDTLKRMTDCLAHRGPDDAGYCQFETKNALIGIGHRRLSIIDLSAQGHQPMSFGNFSIVFNGEIYNYAEIKRDLERLGHFFNSNSDTEVILRAYEQYGFSAFEKFIGMFAIVIFDKLKQELILIRDRVGVKPLFLYCFKDLIMFASELKSFHQHHNFNKELDEEGLKSFFLNGYIEQPKSIFANVQKVKPGHIIKIDITHKIIEEFVFWHIEDCFFKPKLKIDFFEAALVLEGLLKSAFNYRMVSDVPVGVFLSGGIDSSTVTAILQKQMTRKLKTFTIGFEDDAYNEAGRAKKIAQFLGTEHLDFYCKPSDAQELIPELPFIFDEPFADSSAIPTILVSRLAKEKVKVALSADGGDEIFGGYRSYLSFYKNQQITKFLPFFKSKKFCHLLRSRALNWFRERRSPEHWISRLDRLLKATELGIVDYLRSYKNVFCRDEIAQLLLKDSFESFDSVPDCKNWLDKALMFDTKFYLPDDILHKVDRATMSVGLEGRDPMLDHRIIEFSAQLPNEFKIMNSEQKRILKEVTYKFLPKEIFSKEKRGFSIPLKSWLYKDLRNLISSYLNPEKISREKILNPHFVGHILKEFDEGVPFTERKIWSLLVFEMWYEKWGQ